jgi:hypothetical protein
VVLDLNFEKRILRFSHLRFIHAAFITAVLLVGWVAWNVAHNGNGDWALWHWVITGLAFYSMFAGFFLRRKFMRRAEKALKDGGIDAKAVYQWQAAQIVGWAAAEAVALYGALLQMTFGISTWRATPFYAIALFLLILWLPKRL